MTLTHYGCFLTEKRRALILLNAALHVIYYISSEMTGADQRAVVHHSLGFITDTVRRAVRGGIWTNVLVTHGWKTFHAPSVFVTM